MRAEGSYKPEPYEFEVIDDGETALISLYENIVAFNEPETEVSPGRSGWTYDKYQLRRPYRDWLKHEVKNNISLWLNYAKQEEHNLLSKEVRDYRDKLLAESDWTQTLDAPISDSSAREIRAYRQALRDITELPEFPYIAEYPVMPDVVKAGV